MSAIKFTKAQREKIDLALAPITPDAESFGVLHAEKTSALTLLLIEDGGRLVREADRLLADSLKLDDDKRHEAVVQFLASHGIAGRKWPTLRDWARANEVWVGLGESTRKALRPYITVYTLRDMYSAPETTDVEGKATRESIAREVVDSGETTDEKMRAVVAKAQGKTPRGEKAPLSPSEQVAKINEWFRKEGRAAAADEIAERIGVETFLAVFSLGVAARNDNGAKSPTAYAMSAEEILASYGPEAEEAEEMSASAEEVLAA
jgi:hypothetical protein